MEKHPLHIKTPELQKSEDVQKSVDKKERINEKTLNEAVKRHEEAGEPIDDALFNTRIPNDPTDRLEAHMDRLENIFLNEDEDTRKRNIEMLKPAMYDEYVIKPEEVPQQYFDLQGEVARTRGQLPELEQSGVTAEQYTIEKIDQEGNFRSVTKHHYHFPEELRQPMIETVIEDQKHSLEQWTNYLTSDDAMYPTWFKYFVFQNITKLSQFDKSLGKFKKRTKETVAPYPDVHREALAQICDVYEQVAEDNSLLKTDPEAQRQFSASFPKLYAEKITESLAARMESNEEIRGEWVAYKQGNDEEAQKLYDSLQGKGTGWCTAGQSTAQTQIKSGDFYVFYTNNEDGEPTQPRLAIRMDGNEKIRVVRGINEHQEVEPILADVLDAKLSDFGSEADVYKKKSADMKQLTIIEHTLQEDQNALLTKEDLRFLCEIDSSIEGFGYQRDPRIEQLLETRNFTEIMPIIFDCTPEQIATNAHEVNEDTKVYNGALYPNIFKELPSTIEKIYTNFPEKISEVYIKEIELPQEQKTAEAYEKELTAEGYSLSDWAKDIVSKANLEEGAGQKIKLIIPSNTSLGFPQGATRKKSKEKAQALGIANETLPAIVGPELRKQYTDQPDLEYLLVDMESILGRSGYPLVLSVGRDGSDSELGADLGRADFRYDDTYRWAFSQI